MLIPSIDLLGGRIVQLVQGERLAVESDDLDGWIARFSGRPKVQLIDLDAAKAQGHNNALVTRICAALPCRVGGGIRSVARAQEVLAGGATHAIVGSALFANGTVDLRFAEELAGAIGPERLIAAVDSKGGKVVIHGWRTGLPLTAVEAIRELEPFFGGFLYTHVDREGLLQGTDMTAIREVKAATTRDVIAAGGITSMNEVDELDAMGVDAVVGMALYTGRLTLPRAE
ncbi:1-(5-phosphoribosyl)-5-[(5-phosphoribosylamino)methylideneamino]imidazole-4-carboxamide isomerase [soil metagenome]|jgi:phosphoribosylformimino-5-aminoimidazole carboxamide ribotide isomerase|nr:1-(5-phosphoribosyl)-5-[(5-phosphoribosylamino)methylideneamino] imidazole-4-carboxamide isomerase [Acidobacteriota bacterium]